MFAEMPIYIRNENRFPVPVRSLYLAGFAHDLAAFVQFA